MSTPFSEESLASGPSAGVDPTLLPGQYPSSLFGSAQPQGTGASGSQGARPASGGQSVDFTPATGQWQDRPSTMQRLSGPGDSTCLPGETTEGISGLGPSDIASTGAGEGTVVTPHHPGAMTRRPA